MGSCRRRGFYLIQGPLGALGGWVPSNAQGASYADWRCLPPRVRELITRGLFHAHTETGFQGWKATPKPQWPTAGIAPCI